MRRSARGMVPFGGFEMPVQYAGILREHDAVRRRAGMFDLSHMAQFELRGEGVPAWADGLTVNAVATMKPGQARYNIFTNERGGCHDDVLFYRLADRWLLVVNASNADKMWTYLNEHLDRRDVQLEDLHGKTRAHRGAGSQSGRRGRAALRPRRARAALLLLRRRMRRWHGGRRCAHWLHG